MIAIIGAGLAGLAAAARLARVGHQVIVLERDEPDLGAGWFGAEPDVITLPATWRDLFVKSGRKLDAELDRRGLELVPAPPRRHQLSDGATLDLPTDRGAQWTYLVDRFDEPTAQAWRDLLDQLDDRWLSLRQLGLEAEFSGKLTAAQRAVLRPRQSLAALAEEVPALSEVILQVAAELGQEPRRLPGWHAARLAVARNFGRWHLRDAQGRLAPATTLTELLLERLHTRGVELRTDTEVDSIRPRGAELRIQTSSGVLAAETVISTVDPFSHADLTRERADLRTAQRLRRAPGGGPRWESWRTLLDLPRLQPARAGVLYAAGWSPGGVDVWAQLLSGALAAYRCHEEITGEDMRPTNKSYRRGARR